MSDAREVALAALCSEPRTSALLSDFDGSLAPIVTDAPSAVALPGVAEILGRLSEHLGAVAVVSGRPAQFLLERLGQREALGLYGLYGLEEVQPGHRVALTVEPLGDPGVLAELAEELRGALPESVIEEKGHSLALHWRPAPELEEPIRQLAAALAARSGMVVREAKASVELLPPGAPDKGSVVRRVGGSMSCVAYAGDDLGDLPAFDALDELAARGARTIRIVVGGEETPEELLARADLVCRDPSELRELLGELAGRLEQLAEGGAGRT